MAENIVCMMKDEEYEDYLVDKAKELLNEQTELDKESKVKKPGFKDKRDSMDEKAEKESTSKIPFTWDPQEIKHLAENRTKMSNEELRKFFKKDSEFHDKFDPEDWKGFSRWEERFILQNYTGMDAETMASQLDRTVKQVEAKIHMMGLYKD